MLKIIQIVFLVFAINVTVFADEDIKLECTAKSSETYNNEQPEIQKGNLFFNVFEIDVTHVTKTPDAKFIRMIDGTSDIEGLNNINFTSLPHKNDKNSDYSNKNRWHLETVRTNDKGGEYKAIIKIDRNTAFYTLEVFYKNSTSYLKTVASGSCKKVDMTKKKF